MSDALDKLLDEQDDDDAGDAGGNPDNDKRLSTQLHKKEKETETLKKQLEKLEADMKVVVEEKRAGAISEAAKALGIKDKHIGFYTGEPEADAIKQWAIDNEFIEADDLDKSDEKSRGFVPGGLGAPDGELGGRTGKVSLEDAFKIYLESPERFVKLAAAGKVENIDPSRTGANEHMADVDIDFGEQYFSVPRD